MSRALVIIDIQRDYFPGGANPLVEPEAAADAAATALQYFRARGQVVIHLRHVWDAPEATFLRPNTQGVEIHPRVAPIDGELVIEKTKPNGFVGTGLETELRSRGIEEVVAAGMMSCMCVDATVRAGSDLGFAMTVIHDACAAPDMRFGDLELPGRSVHAAFMAALADAYAAVVSAAELTST
jgi:nicotinamidase-related amidase